MNKGNKMAQRKQGVIKNLQIKQSINYEFTFRGKTLEKLFGIGEYNHYSFKIKSWIRIEMYRLVQEIVGKHINSTYFSKNILNQKNVHVLIIAYWHPLQNMVFQNEFDMTSKCIGMQIVWTHMVIVVLCIMSKINLQNLII